MNFIQMLSTLQGVRRLATMINMSVGEIQGARDRPVRFKDGRPVTEGNVNEFIRERTEIYRDTWLLGPLDDVIADLEAKRAKRK